MVTTNVVQSNAPSTSVEATSSSSRRISDTRRSNKPIMEKRRRARINNSLNELKTLILDAMKKDPARHSKLEKADILEMTVKHLQNLQRQQLATPQNDPTIVSKFRAGFSECATEVGRFPGLDPMIKRRLLQHLANCLNGQKSVEAPPLQVHIVPETAPVQLVPTRLPNGDLALVLPNSVPGTSGLQSSGNGQLPLLVPIPQRTASARSASSASNYSPVNSPEPPSDRMLHHQQPQQQQQPRPLSLVVRKADDEENGEEKPWRPW